MLWFQAIVASWRPGNEHHMSHLQALAEWLKANGEQAMLGLGEALCCLVQQLPQTAGIQQKGCTLLQLGPNDSYEHQADLDACICACPAGTVFMWSAAAHAAYLAVVQEPLRVSVAKRNQRLWKVSQQRWHSRCTHMYTIALPSMPLQPAPQ
jgi:hypothetical protein